MAIWGYGRQLVIGQKKGVKLNRKIHVPPSLHDRDISDGRSSSAVCACLGDFLEGMFGAVLGERSEFPSEKGLGTGIHEMRRYLEKNEKIVRGRLFTEKRVSP